MPETFMLDGKQHVLFTSNGSLYMFVLNQSAGCGALLVIIRDVRRTTRS
jgi:hypothetical protein